MHEFEEYGYKKPLKLKLPALHAGQMQVLKSTAKWRILLCGRRWGKSFICQSLSIQTMLKGGSVAYITPNYSLGEDFYRDFINQLPEPAIAEANKSSLYIKLITGGTLKFFSGEATRGIRGRQFDRIIIDEAAFIDDLENIWAGAIMPTLATTNGDALFVSTPNGMNFFHSLYLKGKYNEPNYQSFHFPSHTSPFVSKEFLEATRKTISEEQYKQEYLAEPMSSTGNPFGIHHIALNTLVDLSTKPTVAFGIDVAKSHDYTVIIGLSESGRMTYFDRFRGEWSIIKEKIKALPKDIIKAMDTTGVGDVVFEDLVTTVDNLHSFKFSGKSKPELMRELIVDVQAGKLKYNDVTADEMKVFEYTLTSTGHPKYEAQSGYHDDCICALALANRYRKQYSTVTNWKLYYT